MAIWFTADEVKKFQDTTTRVAKMKEIKNTKCWQGCRATNSQTLPVEVQSGTDTWENCLIISITM